MRAEADAQAALAELRSLAAQNHVYRSFIGTGYYDCATPFPQRYPMRVTGDVNDLPAFNLSAMRVIVRSNETAFWRVANTAPPRA